MTQPITIYEPSLEQTVTDVIRNLAEPGTSDAVADQLRTAGVKGIPGEYTCCPLANLLIQLPGVDSVQVLDDTVLAFAPDSTAVEVELPEPLSEFVARFDKGVYPNLVQQPEAVAR